LSFAYLLVLFCRESGAALPALTVALLWLSSSEPWLRRVRKCLPVIVLLIPLGIYLTLRADALRRPGAIAAEIALETAKPPGELAEAVVAKPSEPADEMADAAVAEAAGPAKETAEVAVANQPEPAGETAAAESPEQPWPVSSPVEEGVGEQSEQARPAGAPTESAEPRAWKRVSTPNGPHAYRYRSPVGCRRRSAFSNHGRSCLAPPNCKSFTTNQTVAIGSR
jgi:hypothetical protein